MKSDINKTSKSEKRQGAGRPRKNIDLEILGNSASIGCTQEEIGSVMGISARTLQRNYAEIIEVNKNKGKASLRKKMWENALKKDSGGRPQQPIFVNEDVEYCAYLAKFFKGKIKDES